MNLLDKIIEEFADNEDLIKKKFGFTAERIVAAAKEQLARRR